MAIESDRFAIEGFGGEFTEYIITLDTLDFQDGVVTATVILERVGSSAIIDESTTTLSVNGSIVDSSSANPFSGGSTVTLSGPVSGNDSVVIEFHTDQWGGHTVTFTTTAPTAPLELSDLVFEQFDPSMDGLVLRVNYSIKNTSGRSAQFDAILTVNGEERAMNSHNIGSGSAISSELVTESNVKPGETVDKEVCINIQNLIEV